MRRVLALSDGITILLTILFFETVQGAFAAESTLGVPIALTTPAVSVPVAVALWFVLSSLSGIYHIDERRIEHSASIDLGRMFQISAAWGVGVYIAQALATSGSDSLVAPTFFLWVVTV